MGSVTPVEAHDDFNKYINDGRQFLKNQAIEAAIQCFENAFAIKGNVPELSFVLAKLFQVADKTDKSDIYYKYTLALKPDHFEYLYDYMMHLVDTARFTDAIEVLQRCIRLHPDNAQLFNDMGVIHNTLQNYSEAIDHFLRAFKINPDYLVPMINLGYLYIQTGEIGKADDVLALCTKKESQNSEVKDLAKVIASAKSSADSENLTVRKELRFSDQSFQIVPMQILDKFGESITSGNIGLSIVIPVFNEEENLPILCKELDETLKSLQQEYEIILIDDGSRDKSRDVMTALAKENKRIKVIFFRRNYGQTAAISAGFKYAHGDVIITLDADLQNDPADIPKLLQKMSEGYDLVNGWRKDRQDKMLSRKIPSMIANRIINKLIEGTNVQLRDFGCTLKAYKSGIVKNIHLYGEMHRFIPVFAAWIGVKVTEIPVNHRPRIHGTAKYNLSRVSRVIFDLIVVRFFSDYMTRPIQFFGKIAKKVAGSGLLLLAALSVCGLTHLLPISLNTILILTALLFFSSMQLLTMGLIGELMIRFYFEVQKKDFYVVERILNDTEKT
ncbi:MAG: glycosyltransferase [Chitinispirillaceae bacterium]|nr:glycosyltransferase [Chitinispirillaceae bacterium]